MTHDHNGGLIIPTGLLRETGEALYGPNWVRPLATALDVSPDTIRAAAEGRRHFKARFAAELIALAAQRREEIEQAASRLEAFSGDSPNKKRS